MPRVKSVEKRIWDVEGFAVQFQADGRNIRDEKEGIPQYKFERAAKNDMTVSDWRSTRFAMQYPGFEVVILDGDGKEVHGGTKLGTVRDTYSEE